MNIRQAQEKDVSRIAEILVYNNRVNFFPIFKDEGYSFGELQVMSVADEYLRDKERLQNTFVFDDGCHMSVLPPPRHRGGWMRGHLLFSYNCLICSILSICNKSL